jgi:hypothetical protein
MADSATPGPHPCHRDGSGSPDVSDGLNGSDLLGSLECLDEGDHAEWLFDSHGRPVAFRVGANVFSPSGEFLGRLESDELWNGVYRGELLRGDRLVRAFASRGDDRAPHPAPPRPEIPTPPAGCRGAIGLPAGYRDVSFG